MIKLVICDGGGSLQLPEPTAETRDLLDTLQRKGIQLAVASNAGRQTVRGRFEAAGLPVPPIIVTREELGVPKPSPLFIEEIQRRSGLAKNEMIYLGDDDRTDTFAAVNAGILPFAAQYSSARTPRNYGLSVYAPKAMQDYLLTFGQQPPPFFGWTYSGVCQDSETTIDVRSLIYQMGDLRQILEDTLKQHQDQKIGSRDVSVRSLLFHLLVSHCYQSGLIAQIDRVAVYPGHKVGSPNPTLNEYSGELTRVFRKKFVQDLLVRHTDAPKSQYQAEQRNIFDQFRTVLVNPIFQGKLDGKRILVIDDFTTQGYSLETARRLLLAAGAGSVTGIAIAKFRNRQAVSEISQEWNPFIPATLRPKDIVIRERSGTSNQLSDVFFHDVIWPHYAK